ncbi:hypothetical protein ABXW85_17175, partial [Streptococcus suis]
GGACIPSPKTAARPLEHRKQALESAAKLHLAYYNTTVVPLWMPHLKGRPFVGLRNRGIHGRPKTSYKFTAQTDAD